MLNKSSEGPSRSLSEEQIEDGLVAHASMSGPEYTRALGGRRKEGVGRKHGI